MRKATVSELKARLSEYLRIVRDGEFVTVLDSNTPVARLTPIPKQSVLRVRKPAGKVRFNRIPIPKGPKLDVDIVELLLEERGQSR